VSFSRTHGDSTGGIDTRCAWRLCTTTWRAQTHGLVTGYALCIVRTKTRTPIPLDIPPQHFLSLKLCSSFTQRELARAPIICSHFPHGNEHVITCVARLLSASGKLFELIHEPKMLGSLPPSTEIQLPMLWLLGSSCPPPPESEACSPNSSVIYPLVSHFTPVHAVCRTCASPASVVRKNSLLRFPAALVNTFCL